MIAKFMIFVITSVFLIAAIYSSSTSVVFAAETKCTALKNGDTICITGDKKTTSYCWHDPKTNRVVGCITFRATNIPADVLAEALSSATVQNKPDEIFKEAIDAAIQESNTTKVPNTDLLTGENLVESQNNTDDDNSKPPKDLSGLKDQDDGPIINPDLP